MPAKLKSSLFRNSITITVSRSTLALGWWKGI
ncbi:MAG: YjbQ family protein [Bacteroidales bacterium]|nr:YjbQ family protein [Bacteroidales bacterium]MCB9013751.1 YjbQ family protein [Bacteroidales bacterium]